jgi:signal transduction histidine kinase
VPSGVPVDQHEAVAEANLRIIRLWEWFGVLSLVVAGVQILLDDTAAWRKAVSVGLLAVLTAWYVVAGRRLLLAGEQDLRRNCGYLFVATLLFAGAAVAVTDASWAMGVVVSQAFWFLPLRFAVPLVVLVGFVPALLSLDAVDGHTLPGVLASGVVFGMLALVVGVTIHRIGSQNEAQAALITRLEASRAEVARLSRQAGTAAERERLAREIHDTLAQGFTSIVTLAQAAESELDDDVEAARRHVRLAARTARENLGEARAMVAALTPSALEAGSLADAVRGQAEGLSEATGIVTSCDVPAVLPKLPTATEVVLLRTAQEALSNVRRHAGAGEVTLVLALLVDSPAGEVVRLTVRDDGNGFDPDTRRGGYGLAGMRARAGEIGGTLEVTSAPGEGTTVTLEVPTC